MEPPADNHHDNLTDTVPPGFVWWVPADTARQRLLIRCLARMVQHALETTPAGSSNGSERMAEEAGGRMRSEE